MRRLCPLLVWLCVGCGGCLGRDLGRAVDYSFDMIHAAGAFHAAHGRYPAGEAELFEGAARAGVSTDRDKLNRLSVRPTPDGGVTIRWAERPAGNALVGTRLRGRVSLRGEAHHSDAPETRPTEPARCRRG